MNLTHLIILNRHPAELADGWIHIVPKGELPNREAGLVQVLDDAALDSILRNLHADQTRLGPKWPGLYLGEEHFIYNDTKSSAALAWAKEFEKRADGLWAKPEFTDLGRQAIENRRFKFTSFVADRRHTQDLGNHRVRILRIDTVGFTNQANGKELLTPVVNRSAVAASRESADHFAEPVSAGSAVNQNHQTKGTMKTIATKLGLAAEASEEAILAAVTKLQNRVVELEPAAAEIATLKNRLAAMDGESVDGLLAERKLTSEKLVNRLRPVLLNFQNRADRVAFLDDCGFKPEPTPAAPVPQGRVLNRGDGKAPGTPALADEAGLASQAAAAINEYRLKNRCSHADARHAVRAQRPELFGLGQ